MRFMLLQDYGKVESDCAPMMGWTPEDIKAHIDFQHALNHELTELGELVDAQGLAGPEQAKFVVWDGDHRWPVPRVEGTARRLSTGRRRDGRAGDRDRRQGIGGTRTERGTDPPADRGAPGVERS